MGCIQSGGGGGRAEDKLPNEDVLSKNANAVKSQTDVPAMKLLLLGAGSSGKTTYVHRVQSSEIGSKTNITISKTRFRKQLRNIFVGFTEQQRLETAAIILENLWLGVRTLATAMQKDGTVKTAIPPETSFILSRSDTDITLDEGSVKQILSFWSSPATQAFLDRRPPHLQLQECVYEFVQELQTYPAWGGLKWTPSVDDCIRARVRSSGVAEEHFVIEGTVFKLFDAGGQRSERRKWIHYFDSVNAVLFVTSLTAYCETLFEDVNQNGLVESLDLFDSIANSEFFRSTPFMLFFNKRDLLEEYLTKLKLPLNRSGLFPDAPDTFDVDKAIRWQMDKFRARKQADPNNPRDAPDVNLYMHVTTATSKDNVNKVFATCRTIILKQSLKKSGFVPD